MAKQAAPTAPSRSASGAGSRRGWSWSWSSLSSCAWCAERPRVSRPSRRPARGRTPPTARGTLGPNCEGFGSCAATWSWSFALSLSCPRGPGGRSAQLLPSPSGRGSRRGEGPRRAPLHLFGFLHDRGVPGRGAGLWLPGGDRQVGRQEHARRESKEATDGLHGVHVAARPVPLLPEVEAGEVGPTVSFVGPRGAELVGRPRREGAYRRWQLSGQTRNRQSRLVEERGHEGAQTRRDAKSSRALGQHQRLEGGEIGRASCRERG